MGGRLQAAGFAVLTPTLPGRAGRPAPPDPTTAALAEAVSPEVPAGALVVGHSLGAVVALRLAADRPDIAGIVLEDPPSVAGRDPLDVAGDVEGAVAEARRDPEGLERRLRAAEPRWAPEDVRIAVADRAAVDGEATVRMLRRDRWDLADLVRTAAVPVAVLAPPDGRAALSGLERAAVLAAADRFVEVDSGHSVHRAQPDTWVEVVVQAAGRALPPASTTQSA